MSERMTLEERAEGVVWDYGWDSSRESLRRLVAAAIQETEEQARMEERAACAAIAREYVEQGKQAADYGVMQAAEAIEARIEARGEGK